MIRKKYYEIGLEYPKVVDKFLKEYGMELKFECQKSEKFTCKVLQ